MRRSKLFGSAMLIAGMIVSSAPALLAQNPYYQTQDLRRDHEHVERLRADIYRDQCRLDEKLREGRYRQAEAIRRDIRRDQARLDLQLRDIRHDRRELEYREYR
jgi:hypothetical protein